MNNKRWICSQFIYIYIYITFFLQIVYSFEICYALFSWAQHARSRDALVSAVRFLRSPNLPARDRSSPGYQRTTPSFNSRRPFVLWNCGGFSPATLALPGLDVLTLLRPFGPNHQVGLSSRLITSALGRSWRSATVPDVSVSFTWTTRGVSSNLT